MKNNEQNETLRRSKFALEEWRRAGAVIAASAKPDKNYLPIRKIRETQRSLNG